MSDVIQAIPTSYRGYRFRSRLEARWAVFYDLIGVQWSYEADPISVGGEPYLPDFIITTGSGVPVYHEVKPKNASEHIRPLWVYLGGKMSPQHDWRGEAGVCARSGRGVSDHELATDPLQAWINHAYGAELDGVPFILAGPFPSSCDHGCAHRSESLHMAQTCNEVGGQRAIQNACFGALGQTDLICAHISTPDAYGTLVELGMAKALKTPVSLTLDEGLCARLARDFDHHNQIVGSHDLWFIEELFSPDAVRVPDAAAARKHHAASIARNTHRNYRLIYKLWRAGKSAMLTFGDPLHEITESNDGHYLGGGSDQLSVLFAGHEEAARLARARRFDGT